MKLDTLIQELEGIHDDFKLIPVKEISLKSSCIPSNSWIRRNT